jgi:biotin carboxyl carrier protein
LKLSSGEVHSPMPGLIVQILVAVGDLVEQGQTVIILESMKMQNELKAPRTGKITAIFVSVGNSVDKDAMLISIAELGE